MPLLFFFDEHLRGTLPAVVLRHARRQGFILDVLQVGDLPEIPLGMPDPDLIRWAALNGRIIVSRDVATLPRHLAAHLAAGKHSPGIILIREPLNLTLADWLVAIAFASDAAEWRDRVTFIP